MKHLAKYHFWFGLIGIIVFILTGQYMDIMHDQLTEMNAAPRMMYRSAHIYLLLTSLCNLFYSRADFINCSLPKWVSFFISISVLAAPIFMVLEFFFGAHSMIEERGFLMIGLYPLFACSVLLIIYQGLTWFHNKH